MSVDFSVVKALFMLSQVWLRVQDKDLCPPENTNTTISEYVCVCTACWLQDAESARQWLIREVKERLVLKEQQWTLSIVYWLYHPQGPFRCRFIFMSCKPWNLPKTRGEEVFKHFIIMCLCSVCLCAADFSDTTCQHWWIFGHFTF